MTDATQYSAMGVDQARIVVNVVATKAFGTDRWKANAARHFGLAHSTVAAWFQGGSRPPFWFLWACETLSEVELLRGYLMKSLPQT